MVGYSNTDGYNTVVILDVPEADLGAFYNAATQRQAFLASRVPGMTHELHQALPPSESIPLLSPLLG